MTEFMKIRELFRRLDDFPYDWFVYLKTDEMSLDMDCAIVDVSDLDPDDDIPFEMTNLGFVKNGLGVADIRDVRENLRLQGLSPSESEMLEAFAYYHRNDAFIVLEVSG